MLQAARKGGERSVSRHLALRWFRVVDEAARLVFAPTWLQADPLTKVDCSPSQRRMLLHVVDSPLEEDFDDICDHTLVSAICGFADCRLF